MQKNKLLAFLGLTVSLIIAAPQISVNADTITDAVPAGGVTLALANYYENYDSVKRLPNKKYSEEDLYWFYQCVEAEEGMNGYRARYLAACCIINRTNEKWQRSMYDVIFAKNQFAVTRNGRIYRVTPSEETIRACNAALDNPETWVIAFSMGDIHSKWAVAVEHTDGEYFYRAMTKAEKKEKR